MILSVAMQLQREITLFISTVITVSLELHKYFFQSRNIICQYFPKQKGINPRRGGTRHMPYWS